MAGTRLLVGFVGLAALTHVAVAEEVSLSKDLMPLFARSCTGCHQRQNGNPDAIKKGVFFEKKEDLLKAKRGLIIPGRPDESLLPLIMKRTADKPKWVKTMPPPRSKAKPLSEAEINKITDWIKAGAKDN